MNSGLFRDEVLAAKSTQWAGSVVLSCPVPMRFVAVAAAVFTIMLALYLTFGEYTRKVHVSGRLVPDSGAIKIVASQFGRVSRCLAQEGDHVVSGQVLYELTTERVASEGDIDMRIDASLSIRREMLTRELQVQNQQLRQRESSLKRRQELLLSELARLDEEVSLQSKRIENAGNTLKRYGALRQQGFISEIQFGQIENDHTEQLARLQTLERARLTSKRELLQVQEDAASIESQVNLNEAQTANSQAALEQEAAEHHVRHLKILAPASGVITALMVERGQTVNAGANLATIIPEESQLEAHLFVPSRAIGFVEIKQEVLLQFASFPYQKFGQIKGAVTKVERSPTVNESQSILGGEPLYRVTVRLPQQSISAYGKEHPYRPGMAVEADIRQDRRRLIEWVFDPLISFTKHRAT